MESWLQNVKRTEERETAQKQGLAGPWSGQVATVNPESETVIIASHGGEKEYPVKHPYLSNDSWIRIMPGVATSAILQYRSDTNQPEIVNYANPAQKLLIGQYKAQKGTFRPLQPGELDLMSKGVSEVYFGRRPVVDARAGIVKFWADQDEAEFGMKAPIHRRLLHQHDSTILGDEERLGVVKRAKDGSPNYFTYPKKDGDFAKEHFLSVWSVGGTPTVLFDKIEGQVFDESGQPVRQAYTNIPLRSLRRYFPNSGSPWQWEIDENGNSAWTLSDSATHGHNWTIPSGNFFLQIKLDWKSRVDQNFLLYIDKNYTLQINQNETTKIGKDSSLDVGGNKTIIISGNSTETISGDKTENITGNYNIKATKTTIESSSGVVYKQPQIAIGNGSVELLKSIFDALTQLGTCTVLTPVGPAAPITASPQWAQVQQVMTQIQSITGSF